MKQPNIQKRHTTYQGVLLRQGPSLPTIIGQDSNRLQRKNTLAYYLGDLTVLGLVSATET
jgi:hypothetical protein